MDRFVFLILIALMFLTACSLRRNPVKETTRKDGQYDSEFPAQPTHPELERIVRTVKLVSVMAIYERKTFSFSRKVSLENLSTVEPETKEYINRPSTGTGTVIYYKDRDVALLTCAHIVDHPDTSITYYKTEKGLITPNIRSFSVKVRQTINVIDLPEVRQFRILAVDRKNDLAIIGKRLTGLLGQQIPVFDYPLGKAGDLHWGTMVYLIAIPRNLKMIATGMVSNPGIETGRAFIFNSNLQKGISGGLVLALRDGVPNFELVGISNSIAAETQLFLQPDPALEIQDAESGKSYNGKLYLKGHEVNYYGMAHAIAAEAIRDFIRREKQTLNENGYQPEYFFK